MTSLYNPLTWFTDSGIVHLRKTSEGRMNIAFSRQKLTFIITGYRDVLRVSLTKRDQEGPEAYWV